MTRPPRAAGPRPPCRPLRLLLAATLAFAGAALPAAAQQRAPALIPLPGAGGAVALQPGALEAAVDLLAERLLRESRRGHAESVGPAVGGELPARATMLSPLRPVAARGRPAGSALRFDGERRSLDFALHLPDPGRLRALRIATLSSINVLPERSSFRVFLNDVFVGTAQLENVTATGEVDFAVPPELARAGANAVRIELVQYHRIYCGPEASFALWSDIDLARSGAVLDAEGMEPGEATFVMGLAAAAATGAGLEIRGAEILGAERTAWIAGLVQSIATAMGGDAVPLRIGGYWALARPVPPAARITFVPAEVPGIRFARGGDGAQVMIVGVPPGSGPVALPDFGALLPALPAAAPVPLIATERPVALAEMGFRSLELRDRYSLTEVRFRLPDDYVILHNLKSQMTLTYIYADDLPWGSVLQVYINGTNIRVLPLRGEAGRLIEDFPLRFEARHLRGGVNTLAFEVIVPGDPADLPCPARDLPVVAIAETSTITAPYSPAMYLPDMHYAFSALRPNSVVGSDLTGRAFSDLDALTLAAAFTGGRHGGTVLPSARLHLTAIDDLGAVPPGPYSISRRALEAVLSRPNPLEPAEPAAIAADEPSLLRRDGRGRDGAPAAFSAGWDWLARTGAAALQWMHPRAGTFLDLWLAERRGIAVLLQLDPDRPEHIWLLRAPGSDIDAIAAGLVAARATGTGPRGQVAVLDAEGRWHNWYAPDRQPVLLEPLTLGNIRHVMGNVVSAMPIRYVAILFILVLVSAAVALRLVLATRETR